MGVRRCLAPPLVPLVKQSGSDNLIKLVVVCKLFEPCGVREIIILDLVLEL